MDDALRTGLWNALLTNHFAFVEADPYGYGPAKLYPVGGLEKTCRLVWSMYFKEPLDTYPKSWEGIHERMRKYFFGAPWNEVYDFVEFIPKAFERDDVNDAFYRQANAVLVREMSAYRFVSGSVVRVTDQVEIDAIESGLHLPRSLRTVTEHLERALEHLSDRDSPDYRNSIKESISAVEGICALATGQQKADFNAALRLLEQRAGLHGALKSAFNSLYGYTSDSSGIRHALLDEATLSHDDAKFMLVACSAFVNYLKALFEMAGIRY